MLMGRSMSIHIAYHLFVEHRLNTNHCRPSPHASVPLKPSYNPYNAQFWRIFSMVVRLFPALDNCYYIPPEPTFGGSVWGTLHCDLDISNEYTT